MAELAILFVVLLAVFCILLSIGIFLFNVD